MIWYVKHHRGDDRSESIRCNDLQKACRICSDLEEVGEVAWVENEQGRKVQRWEFPDA